MTGRQVWRVNGVDLAVTAVGEGPLVLLVHGFPDLAITWRLQIETLVSAGYRVVAPDMRGYGASGRPPESSSYALRIIGQDLMHLLDHEGVEKAHLVGHDWGAAGVWQLGLDHPGRLLSLAGLSVPYALPAPVPPTRILRARLGDDFYMLRFQDADATAALDRDVVHTLAAAFSDDFGAFGRPAEVSPPHWLPSEVFDSYVGAFRDTGFGGGLNYYRNIDQNWRDALTRAETRIRCPSLFLTGSVDPVSRFMAVDSSAQAFADISVEVVEGAGHWVHQQSSVHVNRILLSHLSRADALAQRG